MTRPMAMPEAHVPLLWQALQENTVYDARRRRTTCNYKWVSEHSQDICGAHWSEVTVRTIPQRRLMPPKVLGKRQNQPDPILLRISSLIPDSANWSELTQADLLRTVDSDGGPEIKRASFQRLLPSVRQLHAETPTLRYSDPCIDDMNQLITQIRFKSLNVVRVGAYVLTYKPLIATLLDLMEERPSVEVRILHDKHLCSSSSTELEAIVELAKAGAKVKHLRSYSMHIKMLCVDNSNCNCWSGSGNFGEAAVVVVTVVRVFTWLYVY
ncbi:hypothetical protein PR001_g17712 [Phytophthora rubi]|uniref:Phospholipase D-like domain-containing protein n=1 Tax=Phytophthora rubi TaxID=129364 RepID=A0A6A3KAA8_9STRA|nr:hypothetical protein PR002_g18017 [Phytophthora rubi]KAE9004451.1 hypothetical protein PR001_g17712 [Phytophthora rubi]